MKTISFLSENFLFLEMKFSLHLNRRIFVMQSHSYFLLLRSDKWAASSDKVPKCAYLDLPAHAQSIIRAFALHSYIL